LAREDGRVAPGEGAALAEGMTRKGGLSGRGTLGDLQNRSSFEERRDRQPGAKSLPSQQLPTAGQAASWPRTSGLRLSGTSCPTERNEPPRKPSHHERTGVGRRPIGAESLRFIAGFGITPPGRVTPRTGRQDVRLTRRPEVRGHVRRPPSDPQSGLRQRRFACLHRSGSFGHARPAEAHRRWKITHRPPRGSHRPWNLSHQRRV
jgi:hypothetical protein